MSGEPAPPWLAPRLYAYAARLGMHGAAADTAVQGALAAGNPLQAIAHLQHQHLPPGTPDPDAQWVRGRALGRLGADADAGRALLPQLAPITRTCMAAQPFRRPTLRRLLSALVYRPLSRVLRRAQFLTGTETP